MGRRLNDNGSIPGTGARHKNVISHSSNRHRSCLSVAGKEDGRTAMVWNGVLQMKTNPILRVGIVSLMFVGALVSAKPGFAQTNEELIELIRQQAIVIESLQNRLDRLEQSAAQTAEKAARAEPRVISTNEQATPVEKQVAKVEENASASEVEFSWGPGPKFKSKDGNFSAHIRGRMAIDYGSVKDSSAVGSQDRSATELRNVRFGIAGTAFRDFKYKMAVDFVNNDVALTDAYVEYQGWKALNIRVGQSKEGVSLEQETSGRFVSMMERASFTDAFGYQRRLGVRLLADGDNWIANAGLYGGSTLTADLDKEGHAITARGAFFPEIGNSGRLHFGASFMSRGFDKDLNLLTKRYRQRPFAHVSDLRYVDTGLLPGLKGDQIVGVELAGIFGSFYTEAEWAWLKADIDDAFTGFYNGKSSFDMQGGYVGIGWFVTGETRGYKKGAFARTKVNNSVFEGGFGAVALVARVDYIDLVDQTADVLGGEQLIYVVGVNWHLNNHAIMKFNYAHAEVDGSFGGAFAAGLVDENGENSIDSFTARMQFDW
jgi:phosphate-selective porin OprO/OprP